MQFDIQLRKSESIVVLVDCSRAKAMDRLTSYWLPVIKESISKAERALYGSTVSDDMASSNKKTVVIAISKCDLISSEVLDSLFENEQWHKIFREYPFVACVTR